MTRSKQIEALSLMVRGAYDLQKLRMQCGLRLCANFRAKLGAADDEEESEDGDLNERARGIIDRLKAEYKLLTEGIARNRTLPKREGFVGAELGPEIRAEAQPALHPKFLKVVGASHHDG